MSKKKTIDLWALESRLLTGMKTVAWNIDSPDLTSMYTAASKMIAMAPARSLLPLAMSLLTTTDQSLRKLIYRMAGRNMIVTYLEEFFDAMKNLNPAEREQVLQTIEEGFNEDGGPSSVPAQKKWIVVLEKLGREHQPTVFGLMAYLGASGSRWVTKRIRENIETVSYGSVPKILAFPEKTQHKLIQLMCQKAALKKSELVTYIGGIVDSRTVKFLAPFLKRGTWQDRVEVAKAIGRVGITSSKGLVMDIIADPDWRVKQSLLENINVSASKFSSLLTVLGYVVTDSHTRVRGLAERTLLMMGSIPCLDSDVVVQRKKIEKRFRKQILRAAPVNKDINSDWLGIDPDDMDPIPFFDEEEAAAIATSEESPEGLTLSDIATPDAGAVSEEKGKKDLLAALLSAKESVSPETSTEEAENDKAIPEESIPTSEIFVQLVKKLSKKKKDVSLKVLKKQASSKGISEEEFDKTLADLERDGVVYRSKKGSIRYVEMDL